MCHCSLSRLEALSKDPPIYVALHSVLPFHCSTAHSDPITAIMLCTELLCYLAIDDLLEDSITTSAVGV